MERADGRQELMLLTSKGVAAVPRGSPVVLAGTLVQEEAGFVSEVQGLLSRSRDIWY